MPPGDLDPEPVHPEAAGWVLGVLDGFDAERFAGHLQSCPDCQSAVAELGPAARLLRTAAPAATPPAGLQARTLATVARTAAAARRSEKRGRWRGWNVRMLALAAAVVIAAAVGTGLALSRSAPANTYTVALHSQLVPAASGQAASGHVVVQQTGTGWSIQLTVAHLADLGSGRFYECRWGSSGSHPGHPAWITAGTFVVGSSGTATVQMWTAADPETFPVVQIVTRTAASAGSSGPIILAGTASD